MGVNRIFRILLEINGLQSKKIHRSPQLPTSQDHLKINLSIYSSSIVNYDRPTISYTLQISIDMSDSFSSF